MCESYNRQYGISHGIDYRVVMPTNLYGPFDNYDHEDSHVVPALISRFHEAKIKKLPNVLIWGTGKPRREFLYVDDMARASILVMNIDKETYKKHTSPMYNFINVGSGTDLTIKKLAQTIKKVVDYKGEIKFDKKKPDGVPKKFLDSKRINNLGFKPEISLQEGLTKTYQEYLKT